MVHNAIFTELRAFSDFLQFTEQQKYKMGLFCSIYGQTTLTLQISLQTLWGKGFSGYLSFCPATPTLTSLLKEHFNTFTNIGNLIGKVGTSASAQGGWPRTRQEGPNWLWWRCGSTLGWPTVHGETIGYGIANSPLYWLLKNSRSAKWTRGLYRLSWVGHTEKQLCQVRGGPATRRRPPID